MKNINTILVMLVVLLSSTAIASCQTNGVSSLSVKEFSEKIKSADVIILDVRTPEEFSEGYIPNAININYNSDDFEKQLQKLDPSKEYYVYCASGNRSGKAARIMAEKGFKNVYNMANGGYSDWLILNK